jgi:carboxylesterase type B
VVFNAKICRGQKTDVDRACLTKYATKADNFLRPSGASILHQITAYGGLKGPAPFQQAIPQSPGFSPIVSNLQQENIFQTFLALLNVSTLEQARQLPSAALIKANLIQVANASYGGFGFGPAVDGYFVPLLPGQLLAQGRFDKNLKLLIGHNLNEGLLFTSPFITNQSTYAQSLQVALPDISSSVLNYVDTVLYPPVFTGQYGYFDQTSRAALTIAELVFTCNTFFLDLAFGNQTYAYRFSISPALHGQDLEYTFYNDGGLQPPDLATLKFGLLNVTVALALQDWIVTFTRDGVPSNPDVRGIPKFTLYGPNAMIEDLNLTRITQIMDPAADPRCRWWQKALYY